MFHCDFKHESKSGSDDKINKVFFFLRELCLDTDEWMTFMTPTTIIGVRGQVFQDHVVHIKDQIK